MNGHHAAECVLHAGRSAWCPAFPLTAQLVPFTPERRAARDRFLGCGARSTPPIRGTRVLSRRTPRTP